MSTDLAVRQPPQPVGLFGTDDPDLKMERAANIARILKKVIVEAGLAMPISGREYIRVEGWQVVGQLVGATAKVEWTKPIGEGDEAGWEAAVVVVWNGNEISRAEAECLRSERNWKGRDDYAIRSMAQTRAMGKALRMVLGFVAVLAGYEATPAEEMPEEESAFKAPKPRKPAKHQPDVDSGPEGAEWAEEPNVGLALDLAATISDEAHDRLLDGLVRQRESHQGKVRRDWLERQVKALQDKASQV